MDTPSPTPRWLLPAIVAALLVFAGAIAFALTSGGPPAPVAAPAPTLAPAAAEPQAAPPQTHGGLDPDGPPVNLIAPTEALERYSAGTALFVDMRSGAAWAAGHLPGALTITSPELNSRLAAAPPEAVIIAYGEAARPESGQRGAQILAELGYPQVVALDGSYEDWAAAGYPTEQAGQ